MDKQELRIRFQQRYQRADWIETAKTVFRNVSFFDKPQPIIVSDKVVKGFNQLGFVRLNDGKNLTILEVQVAENVNISRNKVQLRNITTKFIDQENNHGVLVIYDQGKDIYRFTFASKESTFNDKLELEVQETSAKRYTYVLGKGEPCSTAAERFYQLGQKDKATLQDFVEAFSVEKLNKDFFKQYKGIYEKFCKYIASQPAYRKAFKVKEGKTKEETEKNEKPIRDFTKKLMGRIVFLHFLQKKGWMGCSVNTKDWENGDPQFMKNIFTACQDKNKFLSKYLNELFFNTLNNNKRQDEIFSITKTRVPYLNGGLFDNDLPQTNSIDLPQEYFEELLSFFEQYNFTIDENSPDDQEVGIDPEMLGHIFENLLEENREKGAFYTPKEIVHYMCQESILQYLKSHLSETKDNNSVEGAALEKLVRIGDVGNREDKKNFIKANAKRIEELLDKVKICDPAIGSGAFPMGILQEIFKIKMALDLTLDPAKVKKDIIQNTIYGVDLDKGAVDIARLRFWLALVVDEETPQPLPNLDYKIMQGNSLLEQFEGIGLRFEKKGYHTKVRKEVDLFGNVINPQISITEYLQEIKDFDITELEEKYFNSNIAAEKQEIKLKVEKFERAFIDNVLKEKEHKIKVLIKAKQNEFETDLASASSLIQKNQLLMGKRAKDIEKMNIELNVIRESKNSLATIRPEQKPYFLWHLYFMDVFNLGGFDIVIGNPPYIQLQKMGKEADLLQKAGYEAFNRTGDIYCLFYELGCEILKPNGILTFITSNKWMRAGYGETIRKYFINHTNPLWLIDFAGYQVFETATVDTNIFIAQKGAYQNRTQTCVLGKAFNSLNNLSDYFRQTAVTVNQFPLESGWIVMPPESALIKAKVVEQGEQLKDWAIQINYGIKTGLNDAFIIDTVTKEAIVKKSPKSAEIIRPILRGRNIRPYIAEYDNLWLINSHNGIKEKSVPPINVKKDYPAIYEHLSMFKEKLMLRQDKGDDWTNLRNCAYIEEFEKPKIIYPNMTKYLPFVYDKGSFFTNQKCFIITGRNLGYLTAFFNSGLFKYCFRENFPELLGGTRELSKIFFDTIPVKAVNEKMEKEFLNLVEKIQEGKINGENTSQLELNVEKKLADIYNLTEKEFHLVSSYKID